MAGHTCIKYKQEESVIKYASDAGACELSEITEAELDRHLNC